MIKKFSIVDADSIITSGGMIQSVSTIGTGGEPIPGPPGPQGPAGTDGRTPVKGVDYFDGLPGLPGADGYTPAKGVDYFDGEDGADSTVPGPKGDPGDTGLPGAAGEDGADGRSPLVAFGTGEDDDRLTIDGTPTGPHLTGPQGAPGAEGGDPWIFVKLSSEFSTTSSSDTNVTGLAFTPAASKTYLITGRFLLRTATATVGARPGISWPSGLTDGAARAEASNSLTASAIRTWGAQSTANAASTGLASTTNSHYGALEAMIVVGASPSGNFQITLASETAGTAVRMMAGSFIAYREI